MSRPFQPTQARSLWLAPVLAAVLLSGCGVSTSSPSRGSVADPRLDAGRLACMQGAHLPVTMVGSDTVQIGPAPTGPRVLFKPSADAAEATQILGQAEGAEVIGPALLYPNQGSSQVLTAIEHCLAQGVQH